GRLTQSAPGGRAAMAHRPADHDPGVRNTRRAARTAQAASRSLLAPVAGSRGVRVLRRAGAGRTQLDRATPGAPVRGAVVGARAVSRPGLLGARTAGDRAGTACASPGIGWETRREHARSLHGPHPA